METKFNFKSAICTSRSQSERLLALGLKKETADMVYHYTKSRCKSLEWELQPHSPTLRTNTHLNIEKLNVFGHKNSDGKVMTGEEYFNELWGKDIPAWSLDRLMELVPHRFGEYCDYANNFMYYYNIPFDVMEQFRGETRYEYLIDCIEWLIKEGYFNNEYLV